MLKSLRDCSFMLNKAKKVMMHKYFYVFQYDNILPSLILVLKCI